MIRKHIKLIVFDLDGTLVNAYGAVASSINYTMGRLGLPKKSPALIRRSVGWGDRHLIRKFVGDGRLEEALRIYRAHHKRVLPKGTRFLPGAKTILKKLRKKKYRLAIVTNRPSFFTRIILRHLKIRRYFACVVCADEHGIGKPHPRMLRYLLKRFSCKPSEALYVGDMVIDVETAHRARMKAVVVTTGSSTKKELQRLKPHRILRRIAELEGVVGPGRA
jgi:phosphoglycolate phosphatase